MDRDDDVLPTFSGRIASQNRYELSCFVELLRQRKVRSYLEIGAREGDTFYEVLMHLPAGSRGVAVDLPGGLWGKSSTKEKLSRAIGSLSMSGYVASAIFGDSKSSGTLNLVRMRGPYDAILIDGDHTYEGVRADWNNYGDLAPIIAFHDIVGVGQKEKVHDNPVEVPRLWAEIKDTPGFTSHEFVAPGSLMGIGVLVRCE